MPGPKRASDFEQSIQILRADFDEHPNLRIIRLKFFPALPRDQYRVDILLHLLLAGVFRQRDVRNRQPASTRSRRECALNPFFPLSFNFSTTSRVENSSTGTRSSRINSASASHSAFSSGVSRLACGSGPKERAHGSLHHSRLPQRASIQARAGIAALLRHGFVAFPIAKHYRRCDCQGRGSDSALDLLARSKSRFAGSRSRSTISTPSACPQDAGNRQVHRPPIPDCAPPLATAISAAMTYFEATQSMSAETVSG